MKNQLKTILAYFISAFILLLSCGFSVSHVYCSKGEQWVIGSEMPQKNKLTEKHKAEKNASSLDKNNDQSKKQSDQRQKDTIDFRIFFVTEKVQYQKNDFLTDLFVFSNPFIENHFKTNFCANLLYYYAYYEAPNTIRNPELAELQVFII